MVKAKTIIYNVKTKQREIKEEEFIPPNTTYSEWEKPLDLKKLKDVLVAKGIITNKNDLDL